MRKLITLLLTCLLLTAAVLSVSADTVELKVSDAEALPGEVVYLTVSLPRSIQGSSMGIKYSFDEKILKVLPGSCSWEKTGIMKDFSANDHNGVWAAADPVDLQGDVCVLAFEVLSQAKLTQTTVDCTLIVESGGKQEFTAQATVSKRCDHEYGPWSKQTESLHTRTCQLCEKTESQSHEWDDGVTHQKNDRMLKIFTCGICKATQEYDVTNGEDIPAFTQPQESQPVRPTTPNASVDPTTPHRDDDSLVHEHTEPTNSFIGVPVNPDEEDDHIHEDVESTSGAQVLEEEQDHDHDHTVTEPGDSVATAIVVVAVLVLLIGGAVVYIKLRK